MANIIKLDVIITITSIATIFNMVVNESEVIALVLFVVKLLVVLELVALMLYTKLRNSDLKLINL